MPVITNIALEVASAILENAWSVHTVPMICGRNGKACRCKGEEANRAICFGCPVRALAQAYEQGRLDQIALDKSRADMV